MTSFAAAPASYKQSDSELATLVVVGLVPVLMLLGSILAALHNPAFAEVLQTL